MITNEILVDDSALRHLLLAAEMLGCYEFRSIAMSLDHYVEDGSVVVDHFHIEDDQIATRAHVRTGEVNFAQLQQYQREGALLLGSAHSHGDMAVFYSGTDREQFEIDMGAFNGFAEHEYLEFEPRMTRCDGRDDVVILRGFNTTNLDLEIPSAQASLAQELHESMTARLLMRRTKTLVGITVNNRGDLFGIKRVRDSRFLFRPGDTWEHDPSWQDVRTSGNTVEYSLECEVVALGRGSGDDIDADRLLEELRRKIRFDGEPPPAFRKTVAVSRPVPDRRTLNAATALIDYGLSDSRHSRQIASAIAFTCLHHAQLFSDALLRPGPSHFRLDEISPLTFAQALAAQRGDRSIEQLVRSLNPGLLSKLIGHDDAARVIETWVDRIVELPAADESSDPVPAGRARSFIIKCDAVRDFHAIRRHYLEQSTDSNYLSLHSTLCRVKDFKDEYQSRFHPPKEHIRLLDLLIDTIEHDLGRRRTREQLAVARRWRTLRTSSCDESEPFPADQLWSLRDAMVLLGLEREASEVNQKLEVARVEYHSQGVACRSPS